MFAGRIDEMQQHAAALDMPEKPVAEPRTFMRALDQAGNISEHEFAALAFTTPSCGCRVVKG